MCNSLLHKFPGAITSFCWRKSKGAEERLWYARAAVANGWSRNVLVHWIESDLHKRQGRASTNFERSLPAPQSDLARELLKDPYNFDFLTLTQETEEREIERGLVEHIRDFLLELGVGFTPGTHFGRCASRAVARDTPKTACSLSGGNAHSSWTVFAPRRLVRGIVPSSV